jgi:hypothetical protein
MRKWMFRILLAIVATPIIGLIVWYGISFLPHINEIKEMSDSGAEMASPVYDPLKKLAVASETKKGIRVYAIRQAYWSLVFSEERSSTLSWHANNTLWYLVSNLHYSEEEVFGLWVSCALAGCGKGLPDVALKYYGKTLNNMSERELAGLVAMVRSPSKYKPGSSHSEKRIEYILNRAKANNTSISQAYPP